MKNTLLITLAVGAIVAGAAAYLIFTEDGQELLAGIVDTVNKKIKDVA